ncbi:unnamed protein product [Bursaphelenchus xylophilus]|uniref:DNA polymerase n=1 Tax=Bursaphelenchus xylophilus TaxID=6326 RepID=A0A1I7RYE6_BURXY|nr:unnamed protein product [Bursaphelenchus xylophilus]CAG9085673.1 unnamed protein product [Bursaphelenchus xylophilus]
MSDGEGDRRRSSRRPVNKEKDAKASALERLKEARLSGKRSYRARVDDMVQDVLVDVDEEEYNRRYRAADFVDDDDGAGYADSDEDEKDILQVTSKNKKKVTKREEVKGKKAGDITQFLRPDIRNSEKTHTSQADDEAALAEALAQLDETADNGAPMFDFLAGPLMDNAEAVEDHWQCQDEAVPSTPEVFKPATIKRVRRISEDEICASKVAKLDQTLVKSEKPDLETTTEIANFVQPDCANVNEDFPIVEESVVEEIFGGQDTEDPMEEDEELEAEDGDSKSVKLFCLDFYETAKGTVFMFGKIGQKSCCIEVKGIERVVYFIPVQEEMEDLKKEVTNILKKEGINQFRSKETNIKYVPDADDMEKEMKALMVAYDSTLPALSMELTGTYFKRVLNVNASPLERLLMESNLRTPGFVQISNIEEAQSKKSYCELEFTVNNRSMKNIIMAPGPRFAPKIKMLVMNVASVFLPGGNREIIAINGLFKKNASLDRANDKNASAYDSLNFIAKPTKGTFPITLNDVLTQKNMKNKVFVHQNERALLAAFLVKVKELDPDLIVMHGANEQLDLLKTKLARHKISTFSFFSKLKKTTPIDKIGRWNLTCLTAGRLVLCSKEAAAELDTKSKSQNMEDLVPSLLTPNDPTIQRTELTNPELLEPFFSANGVPSIFKLLKWSWHEAYLSLLVVLQLNALPLFVRITQIVGGVMSRTLVGGRSQRNEFLFLHAFYERGYVPWDKKKRNKEKQGDSSGGTVVDPKTGLYETYIVLLDFNSLYPSIIQEFNICFTTVDKCYRIADKKDVLSSIPDSDVPQGILPKEIGELVRKRRAVKQEMKRVPRGSDRYLQLDVEQLGLKLTANSMYGCLGATDFRFYANFLAIMITLKGRSLLARSQEIAERSYRVIYGDTDSIMVNSNTSKHQEAVQIANRLKKDLNGKFKHIEMDIDGLFKKFLLLKKKTYAALTVSVNDENDVKTEIKGLQIVRRDCSDVVKKAGRHVLDIVLGPSDSKSVDILAFLTEWKEKLLGNQFSLEEFQIYQKLSKDLNQYGDGDKHSGMAKRLNQTGKFNFRVGDMVKYIVCNDGSGNSSSKRLYHITELEEANKTIVTDKASDDKENVEPIRPKLAVDYKYYQESLKTIVSTICEPLEDLEVYQISEALGLDPSKDRSRPKPTNYSSGDFNRNDTEYDGFSFECPHCQKNVIINSPVIIQDDVVTFTLETCLECGHGLISDQPYLITRCHQLMDEYISRNSKSPFRCEKCEYTETDMNRLMWRSHKYVPCCPECFSNLTQEYDLAQLCEQQQTFSYLFDLNLFISKCKNTHLKKKIETAPNFQEMKHLYGLMSDIAKERWMQNKAFKIDLTSLLRSFRIK